MGHFGWREERSKDRNGRNLVQRKREWLSNVEKGVKALGALAEGGDGRTCRLWPCRERCSCDHTDHRQGNEGTLNDGKQLSVAADPSCSSLAGK